MQTTAEVPHPFPAHVCLSPALPPGTSCCARREGEKERRGGGAGGRGRRKTGREGGQEEKRAQKLKRTQQPDGKPPTGWIRNNLSVKMHNDLMDNTLKNT